MIRKLFSVILAAFILNISFLPALAAGAEVENPKFLLNPHLVSKINVNNSNKGQIVQFVSDEDYTVDEGFIIPKGTLFNGKIYAMKKSRFGFRRAKAKIRITEMVLPNGEKYALQGRTKRHVYKGSAVKNVIKGTVSTPAIIVVGVIGYTVVLVEAITIVGLVIAGPSAAVVGEVMGKLSNGVNCKIKEGTNIPIEVRFKHKKDASIKNIEQNSTFENDNI